MERLGRRTNSRWRDHIHSLRKPFALPVYSFLIPRRSSTHPRCLPSPAVTVISSTNQSHAKMLSLNLPPWQLSLRPSLSLCGGQQQCPKESKEFLEEIINDPRLVIMSAKGVSFGTYDHNHAYGWKVAEQVAVVQLLEGLRWLCTFCFLCIHWPILNPLLDNASGDIPDEFIFDLDLDRYRRI